MTALTSVPATPTAVGLTDAQRYHYDTFGFVVLEETHTAAEVEALRSVLLDLRDRALAGQPTPGVTITTAAPHLVGMARFFGADPVLDSYLYDERLVGICREVAGGSVRIGGCSAIVNSRDPNATPQPAGTFPGLHAGTRPPWGSYEADGHHHSFMPRVLTNLTDLGPGDGGTVLVKGSHRSPLTRDELIAIAHADPSLVHEVVAPAGSTLLFSESTIHATGVVRSDRERAIISTVFMASMFQPWDDQGPTPEMVGAAPEHARPLLETDGGWIAWNRAQGDPA